LLRAAAVPMDGLFALVAHQAVDRAVEAADGEVEVDGLKYYRGDVCLHVLEATINAAFDMLAANPVPTADLSCLCRDVADRLSAIASRHVAPARLH
jgi:hypothetical protein